MTERGQTGSEIAVTATTYGHRKGCSAFALASVLNDLTLMGAGKVGITASAFLPPDAYKHRGRPVIKEIERAGSAHDTVVLCATAEPNPAVHIPMITMTGIGRQASGMLLGNHTGKPNQDIVLIGWIGLAGTLQILKEKETLLEERFVPAFLKQIRAFESELYLAPDCIPIESISAVQQIKDGGIFAALWDMAEASGVGLDVDLKKMSIRQETIEVCEYFHLNPYQLTSVGAALLMTEDGKALTQSLQKNGVHAVILGTTNDGNDRIIRNGEDRRFIDKPAPDELVKLFSI